MSNSTKLHFARFEFKYLLPPAQRQELERELGYFVEFDPYVVDLPEQKYFVRSLYFDDPFFGSYFDKIDGLHTRAKFRLRTYTDTVASTVPKFLEIKGRHNNLVFKHRVILKSDFDGRRDSGRSIISRILDATSGPLHTQFEYEFHRRRLRPIALIDYFRRPYVSKYDPEFRLTFDEQLAATKTSTLFPPPGRSRKILQGYTVLEVKFRYHLPSWFHRLIQSYELRRISISKICSGVEVLGLASE